MSAQEGTRAAGSEPRGSKPACAGLDGRTTGASRAGHEARMPTSPPTAGRGAIARRSGGGHGMNGAALERFNIGVAAARSGVSPKMVRHY